MASVSREDREKLKDFLDKVKKVLCRVVSACKVLFRKATRKQIHEIWQKEIID